jgi:hypothetical protein
VNFGVQMTENKELPGVLGEGVSKNFLTMEENCTEPLSKLAEKTKNDPNRHTGISSCACHCGLVHDDELLDPKQKRANARNELVDLLGGRCANKKCRWLNRDKTFGCTDKQILQVDHVFDDGFIDRKVKGPYSYWRRVLDEVKNGSKRYQLLCANCNWKKRWSREAQALKNTLYKFDYIAERMRKVENEQ